jgi:hypothetical protein
MLPDMTLLEWCGLRPAQSREGRPSDAAVGTCELQGSRSLPPYSGREQHAALNSFGKYVEDLKMHSGIALRRMTGET